MCICKRSNAFDFSNSISSLINVFTGLNLLLLEGEIWKLNPGTSNTSSPSCIYSSQTLPVLGLRKKPVLVTSSCSISSIKLEELLMIFLTYTEKVLRRTIIVKDWESLQRLFQIHELIDFETVICSSGYLSENDFPNWVEVAYKHHSLCSYRS